MPIAVRHSVFGAYVTSAKEGAYKPSGLRMSSWPSGGWPKLSSGGATRTNYPRRRARVRFDTNWARWRGGGYSWRDLPAKLDPAYPEQWMPPAWVAGGVTGLLSRGLVTIGGRPGCCAWPPGKRATPTRSWAPGRLTSSPNLCRLTAAMVLAIPPAWRRRRFAEPTARLEDRDQGVGENFLALANRDRLHGARALADGRVRGPTG